MRVDEFDFVLPEDRIALRPAVPRDAARLLVVGPKGEFSHRFVRDLPDLLHQGDCLVLNDTKVIAARLRGHRVGRGVASPKVEMLLHKRISADAFLAFARPARKLAAGDELVLGNSLVAHVRRRGEGGEVDVQFELSGPELDGEIARQGEVPLPPYITGKRQTDEQDRADYQTLFARHGGSVAAPTAGLHFTQDLLKRLSVRYIGLETVTLHVGAGTFLPVSAPDTANHRMHAEWASVDADTANRLNSVRKAGGRIVAVGTTSLRTLESAASDDGRILPYAGETDIFITPGYRFKAVDILLTNFHLPRSTLFMLVSAFCGLDVMRSAYAEAIREHYRFYSYGDACLLFRPQP
ncbi:MAG: tRNA preQ1(34) S-adenosylmethionine ribosyltransferase-isomerase QueA [Rhizomicrobium sp.]